MSDANGSATSTRLKQLRVNQNGDNPNFCLGAAKFFAGKLIGLFGVGTDWNMFMNSNWAKKHGGRAAMTTAWGLFRGEKFFNSVVLPAAMGDASAGVALGEGLPRWKNIEFHHNIGAPGLADALLRGRVPLVVGVNLYGGGGRDHFITLLRDRSMKVWAVDSWGTKSESDAQAVAQLPMDFSFSNPVKADLSASKDTMVPSAQLWIGYYRDRSSKAAIGMSSVI